MALATYRRALRQSRKLQSPKHGSQFFTDYVRHKARHVQRSTDRAEIYRMNKMANLYSEWRETIHRHTVLLDKYGYLLAQDPRLYIKKQAEAVGLQVPLFWDEKPDRTDEVENFALKLMREASERLRSEEFASRASNEANKQHTAKDSADTTNQAAQN